MSGRRLRLGVALLVPEPVRREVDALRAAVGDGSLGRVPAHLTLVPPVNVHRRDTQAALDVLRGAASDSSPFTLELGPPGTFLPENPVLYLQAAGDLDALVRLRERVFRPPLERRLSWPWVPHVTLCDEGEPGRISAAADALRDYRARASFERVHLLHRSGGVWEPWADAALGGRRVVGRGGLELEITESAHLEPDTRAWMDDAWAAQNEAEQKRWHEQPVALTARREDRVVGAATGWTNEGVAHLAELLVDRTSRGQGVGTQLLAAFEDVARRRACARLSLRTDLDTRAHAFYERRGWKTEAVFEGWIDGVTTVQMRKDL